MILFGHKKAENFIDPASDGRWVFSTTKGIFDTHMIDAEAYPIECKQHFPKNAGKYYDAVSPQPKVWFEQICGQCEKPIMPHSWVIKENT